MGDGKSLVESRELETVIAGQSCKIGIRDLLMPHGHAPIGTAYIHVSRNKEMSRVPADAFKHYADLVNADVAAQLLGDAQETELSEWIGCERIGLIREPLLCNLVLKDDRPAPVPATRWCRAAIRASLVQRLELLYSDRTADLKL